MTIKILNLYAGIGGNRKLWFGDIEVTAIENNQEIAKIYQEFFPQDKVIVTDAHQYLLEHFRGFDFIWSSPPCFIWSELVLTMRGHIPIKDVRIGDLVLTHKNRWRKVLEIGKKHSNVIRRIKGIGVDSIRCTSNHPFYVRTLNKNHNKKEWSESYWCEAKDIKDKYWCSPINVNSDIHNYCILNPYLIGRWLGDGWVRKEEGKKATLICCGKHKLDKILPYFKLQNLNFIQSEERTTYRFSLYDENITNFLMNNFGYNAKNKLLAGWVFGESKEFREQLLQGYLDSDGYYEKKRNRWVITSVSRQLIYGIELLSQTLGYRCSIAKPNLKSTHIIEGRIVNQNQTWILSLKKIDEGTSRQFIIDDKEYSKVKNNKTETWNGDVYDIKVEEDESYTINNKIVHNCPTHSRVRFIAVMADNEQSQHPSFAPKYPNMDLYQEIILLMTHFKGKFVVENVIGYYEPLIKPQEMASHYFWANFNIGNLKIESRCHNGTVEEKQKLKGFDLSGYEFKTVRKDQVLRNCVEPETGLHIFNMAFKEPQLTLI